MTELILPVRMLHGHTDQASAYMIDDYPYGRHKRCRRRVWVETATRGAKKGQQRFVAQTTDPDRVPEFWNKPHPGQYFPLVFPYLDEIEHVHWLSVTAYGIRPEEDARLRFLGLYDQMSPQQRTVYDALVALSRRYAEPWDRWHDTVAAMAKHISDTGEAPQRENAVWVWDGGRAYIADHDLPVYVTAAHRMIAAIAEVD